jgi:hypothetical protein
MTEENKETPPITLESLSTDIEKMKRVLTTHIMFIQEFCNSIATIGLNLNILKIESVPVTPEAETQSEPTKEN